MTKTNKPQCQAAREYILALHAHKNGEISKEQLAAKGDHLNRMLDFHGKPTL